MRALFQFGWTFWLMGAMAAAAQGPQGGTPVDVEHGGNRFAYWQSPPPDSSKPTPVVVFLASANPEAQTGVRTAYEHLRPQAAARNWGLIAPVPHPALLGDSGVQVIEALLRDYGAKVPVDRSRVYLLGSGGGAVQAFYLASRVPHQWAAVLAVSGSPKPAIDSNRLFAANTALVPVLWLMAETGMEEAEPLYAKLKRAGFNLELRTPEQMPSGELLAWFEGRERDATPSKVDCETGASAFTRCYWIEIAAFDFSQRNDALRGSRVPPGAGASLDLGGFGFDPKKPGPGLLVEWLPDGYQGPLRTGDRILAVGGTPLPDGSAYVQMMDEATQERPVAVRLQRGKQQVRLETRIVLPARDETQTARVTGEYDSDRREIILISRGANRLRIRIPGHWAPTALSWNGIEAPPLRVEGCYELELGAEGTVRTGPCLP